ncbi:hypothetical protein SNOG_09567 [Parastagonospora nodorum SN15]|uniref:Uncharacterized protein n=1 Tax=Phaeosphaeria nodorum (strain SN15 / ATCC MYA-4574 / FGSC 10173) TaxID=321614 RepID=Q0UF97_PHANO|nr:hypothetical protein SNOG_09567 [Parastagonospora nodorum SN15]EAT82832.2 hypothetical protein SNOG_09567 [Parastagonospora nodorum SN15]
MAFRCPSSLTKLDGSSPRVCAPYLQARSYAAPYLDPYYQTYAAPYVEKAKPYADRFEKQVYTPAAKFTADKYATYGAHRVEQAKKYSNAQWDKSVRPQLQTVQDKVKGQYDLYLGPHVKTASDAAAPYYDQAKASLEEIYHLSVLPAYEASLPYMRKAHTHGHHVVVNYVFPYVRSVKDATFAFLVRTVWPQVRVLYGDNVEPQLVRISERLGRYRDQKKVESVVNSIESDFTTTTESTTEAPAMTVSEAAPVPTTKSGWGVFDDLFGADPSSSTASDGVETKPSATRPVKSQPTGEELKKMLNEDLRKWQTKFATAADKGSEDLEQRVAEITKRQVESGVKGHGRALVVKLEETADSTVASLKSFIKRTVESVPEDATDEDLEAAHAKCSAKTRELGLSVKERAQDVRAWKANYDQETDSLVKAAVKSTVVVLDKIHGLGLQEVGMRWAWLDGVTYQDWQNYHKLRTTLDEWQAEVEAVGSQHDGLRIAHEEAKKLEDEAMEASTRMVSELIRLKDVAKWKLWANDATDDFSNKPVPARVYKAAQQVSSQVSEAIQGSSTPISESVASAISSASSQASEAIQAAPSHASEAASSLSSGASEAIQGSSTPLSESAASSIESLSSQASEALLGSETPIAESVASSVSSAASAAYESPKKVFGGANAQILAEAKQVIFDEPLDDGDDDDDTVAKYSRKLQNVVADAGDRAEELSRAVSEALLGATKTQGTVESATSLASEQYERALAAASSVLYGTQQPVVESATSVASERFAQAVTAASYAMYGTPTPTAIIHTVQVQASSRYSDALRLASEQYENAKSQVSVLASGTPKPAHESLLSYFEKAYSDSVDVASERLSAALQYTDSVKSYAAGPTQGYFESVSSIASSRLSDGLSQASAQFSQPTGGASRQYYEAIGLAHARYSEFVGAASSAVLGIRSIIGIWSIKLSSIYRLPIGTETPWSESVASQASINWESLIAKASDQVYESVYSQAGAYGAQATVAAAQQYADVSALISELVIGKEPAFTESIMVRLSSAYYTGVPAAVQSVQSYAEDNFDAASSYAADAYSSASSVVSSIFTPPAAIETILSQASAQLDAAVDSASIAVYGTPKGAAEQASESVASAYSSIQSQISVKVYGTQQAQDSFTSAAASAQQAISQAIFGTPTAGDYVASATSGAGNVYSSIASVASENADYAYSAASEQASKVASAASSAIYGPEQGAMESASSRIALAVEAANSRISEIYAQASKGAEGVASTVSSAATQATQRVKDEL